jgi:hypothetical protein
MCLACTTGGADRLQQVPLLHPLPPMHTQASASLWLLYPHLCCVEGQVLQDVSNAPLMFLLSQRPHLQPAADTQAQAQTIDAPVSTQPCMHTQPCLYTLAPHSFGQCPVIAAAALLALAAVSSPCCCAVPLLFCAPCQPCTRSHALRHAPHTAAGSALALLL